MDYSLSVQIRITIGRITLEAELNDSVTAKAIRNALPLTGSGNRWGEEIYFSIPIQEELESGARAEMGIGELAYWPPGSAFCIFFGPTPASNDDRPRAASAVNPIGKITSSVMQLKDVVDGDEISIESA